LAGKLKRWDSTEGKGQSRKYKGRSTKGEGQREQANSFFILRPSAFALRPSNGVSKVVQPIPSPQSAKRYPPQERSTPAPGHGRRRTALPARVPCHPHRLAAARHPGAALFSGVAGRRLRRLPRRPHPRGGGQPDRSDLPGPADASAPNGQSLGLANTRTRTSTHAAAPTRSAAGAQSQNELIRIHFLFVR